MLYVLFPAFDSAGMWACRLRVFAEIRQPFIDSVVITGTVITEKFGDHNRRVVLRHGSSSDPSGGASDGHHPIDVFPVTVFVST